MWTPTLTEKFSSTYNTITCDLLVFFGQRSFVVMTVKIPGSSNEKKQLFGPHLQAIHSDYYSYKQDK